MKLTPTKLFYLFTLFISLSSSANAFQNNAGSIYLEGVIETDGTADLSGFHIIRYNHSIYYGGGIVYVNLPNQNESFLAVHALTGTDLMLTENIGLTFEFGFDIGEDFLSVEDQNLPSATGIPNQIDFNFAAGVVIKLENAFYAKGYVRYHAFDGVFLPPTNILMVGGRIGIKF